MVSQRSAVLLLLCLHCLILVACASVKPADSPVLPAKERAVQLRAFDDFQVRGGLGIWDDSQSISSRFDWRQQADNLDITLTAVLGLGSVQLVRNNGQASLRQGNAEPVVATSIDQLLRNGLGLGVTIPVDKLSDWIRGLPGDATDVKYDSRALLTSLRYRDSSGTRWTARVLKHTEVESLEVPALMVASGGGYNVRLVLKNWQRGGSDLPDEGGHEQNPDTEEVDTPPARLRIPGRS